MERYMTSPIYRLSLLVVIFFACASSYARTDEPRIANLRVSADWDEIPRPEDVSRKGWEVRMFKDKRNGDILVVAKSDQPHPRSSDDVVEFAPSGYPYWFKENDGFTINRVKVEDGNEFSLNGVKLASKAYCVVNEDGSDESTVMGQGYLVLTSSSAFYIQHSSRRPIAHWTARNVVESLLETATKTTKEK